MTSSNSSSQLDPQSFIGVAYGEVQIEQGQLCLHDSRIDCCCCLPFITSDRTIAERLLASVGERVRLTFELNELSHAGYVIPRQLERCPEEYAPPRMEGLIFTDQPGCGLQSPMTDESPFIAGHLMASHLNGQLARPHSFYPSPLDFMLLVGGLDDPSDGWIQDTVIRAQLELQYTGSCTGFSILKLISLQDQTSWRRQQVGREVVALPGQSEIEAPAEVELQGRPPRRAISTRLRYEIFRRDGHRCVDCGASAHDDPLVRLEVDHRIPVSKGGTNDPNNLQTLCWACNNGKSDRVDHKLDLSDLWEVAIA